MRITYRDHGGNRSYWQERWSELEADGGLLAVEKYPGKYALAAVKASNSPGPILEAGCGAGRVLLNFHTHGRAIVGIDFIPSILSRIRAANPTVPLLSADISHLPFRPRTFSTVLAFGLFHNLETGIDNALAETRRTMQPSGVLCASFRLDNIQNSASDWLRRSKSPNREFHKVNLTPAEIRTLMLDAGFTDIQMDFVGNMPLLYKFTPFRHKSQRKFDESNARDVGYRLTPLASAISNILKWAFPKQLCNLAVVTARAP